MNLLYLLVIISYVTCYFTILLSQPNQPPKEVTHNLFSSQNLIHFTVTTSSFDGCYLKDMLKHGHMISRLLELQHYNSSNQNKPLVEKYICVCTHRNKISEDKKHIPSHHLDQQL